MSFSSNMSNMRLAVVRGGTLSEYENSLRSGKFILDHVPQGCTALDVLVDKNGVWHVAGFPKLPVDVLHQVDVAWNVLHTTGHNEAAAFRLSGTPVIGLARTLVSLFANVSKNTSLRTPRRLVVRKDDMTSQKIHEIFTTFPHPAKVTGGIGSSIGSGIGSGMISHIVTKLPELHEALAEIFSHAAAAVIEEHIAGRHAVVGMINGYRGVPEYVLPVMEVRKNAFDYRSLREDEKKEVSRMASQVHRALGAPQYSQSEYVIHPRRGVFLVEANASPILHETSPFIHSLGLVGARPEDFVEHVLTAKK